MSARAAIAAGTDQLGVANLDEGLALRQAGVSTPILVVYPIEPGALSEAVEAGLEVTVSGLESTRAILDAWSAVAHPAPAAQLTLHVEVDTGMGRGGIAPDGIVDLVRRIDATPRTSVAGIWTHLADGGDAVRSNKQTGRFEAAVAHLAATGRPVPMRHLVTTEGIFAGTAPAYEMVRVGLGFYGELGLGFRPAPTHAHLAAELRPALTLKARPIRLGWLAAGASVGYGGEWTAQRRSLIATLPIGYADGWTRAYWPGATALLRGRRVPLVGRVSMDAVCADVTEVAGLGEVTLADELVLLGAQGGERITANELARLRGSIPNEVLSTIGPRLPRVFLGTEALESGTGAEHRSRETERP